jgi:hypothetical protein
LTKGQRQCAKHVESRLSEKLNKKKNEFAIHPFIWEKHGDDLDCKRNY